MTVDLRPAHRTPALMDDYQRLMAAALAEQTVACPKPTCNAQVGEWCKSTGGYQNSAVRFHTARKKLIAHLTEDERIAAFAAMGDAQDRDRAASDARWRELKKNPEWVAQQEATRVQVAALFDRADEEFRNRERRRRTECADMYLHGETCMCKVPGWAPAAPAREIRRGVLPVTDLGAVRAVRRAAHSTSPGVA